MRRCEKLDEVDEGPAASPGSDCGMASAEGHQGRPNEEGRASARISSLGLIESTAQFCLLYLALLSTIAAAMVVACSALFAANKTRSAGLPLLGHSMLASK